MDLETENRLAALLMEEARRLKLLADREGVHVYLQQPNVRKRPNARFLAASVLGAEQANRAVEVNEMWCAREKEMELDSQLRSKTKGKSISNAEKYKGDRDGRNSRNEGADRNSAIRHSSSKHSYDDYFSSMDGGLRDQEVEDFLHSRAKRGRGSIGSRTDEPGQMPSSPSAGRDVRLKEEWEQHVLGTKNAPLVRPQEARKDAQAKKSRDGEASSRKHHSHAKNKSVEVTAKLERKKWRSKHHYKS